MVQQPLISFIIPVLNEEKTIVKTLQPLKSLKINKEIIVTDSGSSDKTVNLARKYADQVETTAQTFPTIAANRNKGARVAKGDILFFIDCDVRIGQLNDLVKKVLIIFKDNPKVVGLTISIRFFPQTETFLDRIMLWLINNFIKIFNKCSWGTAMGWVMIVKNKAFWSIGGFNEKLVTTEDSDLFRRLNKVGKTIYLGDYIAYGSSQCYHQNGWLKIVGRWLINTLWYIFFKKSYTKKW